jgi:hypothetical protein
MEGQRQAHAGVLLTEPAVAVRGASDARAFCYRPSSCETTPRPDRSRVSR